jgi:AcrR family transcriptional regulator
MIIEQFKSYLFNYIQKGVKKMSKKPEDRRTRKTTKAIKMALVKLMLEHDISKITIKEIADEADINRGTFYAHYHDVYEVLEQIEDEIIHTLYELIDEYDFQALTYSTLPLFLKFSEVLNEDREFSQLLFLNESSITFLNKLKRLLKDKIIYDNIQHIDQRNLEAFSCSITFVASGTIELYKEWFKGNIHMTIEELSKTINHFIMNGSQFILKS